MKFHIISRRDLNRLIKQGDVTFDKFGDYSFREGMPTFIPLLTDGMSDDVIASRRREFEYNMNIEDETVFDPFIDGISGEYDKWFVPLWCIVEWLKKRGIL